MYIIVIFRHSFLIYRRDIGFSRVQLLCRDGKKKMKARKRRRRSESFTVFYFEFTKAISLMFYFYVVFVKLNRVKTFFQFLHGRGKSQTLKHTSPGWEGRGEIEKGEKQEKRREK